MKKIYISIDFLSKRNENNALNHGETLLKSDFTEGNQKKTDFSGSTIPSSCKRNLLAYKQ
jgi:hypothetical protein